MQVPFIEEGIDDLAPNGVESQIAYVFQVTSAETTEDKERKKKKTTRNVKRINAQISLLSRSL